MSDKITANIKKVVKGMSNLSISTRSSSGMYFTEVDVSDIIPTGYMIGAVSFGDWTGLSNRPINIYTYGNKVCIFAPEQMTIATIDFVILLIRS